jgi:hypothetical protein
MSKVQTPTMTPTSGHRSYTQCDTSPSLVFQLTDNFALDSFGLDCAQLLSSWVGVCPVGGVLVRNLRWIWPTTIVAGLIFVLLVVVARHLFVMPGQSYTGVLPPLTVAETGMRARLQGHVQTLEGQRHVCNPHRLRKAADDIKNALKEVGLTPSPNTGYRIDK